VTAAFEITHPQRAAWQRRAATTLTEILAAHRDLPTLVWTVAGVGSALVGRVSCSGPCDEVRAVFDAWCDGLSVERRAERPSPGGAVWLWATTQTGPVTVSLTATVLPNEAVG
jgi:hypothetical protein